MAQTNLTSSFIVITDPTDDKEKSPPFSKIDLLYLARCFFDIVLFAPLWRMRNVNYRLLQTCDTKASLAFVIRQKRYIKSMTNIIFAMIMILVIL